MNSVVVIYTELGFAETSLFAVIAAVYFVIVCGLNQEMTG